MSVAFRVEFSDFIQYNVIRSIYVLTVDVSQRLKDLSYALSRQYHCQLFALRKVSA
jgi:hypothetical protein